jgi:predicted AAA+ superfamily ATPase
VDIGYSYCKDLKLSFIIRELSDKILFGLTQFPIVVLTGPRQSGKTTLLKNLLPHFKYVSLEDPDVREEAKEDPRGFLGKWNHHVIFDEIQRVPELLSYMQSLVDLKATMGEFVLTGSNNFLMMETVNQSLAGRAGVYHLLPLSYSELCGEKGSVCLEGLSDRMVRPPKQASLWQTIFSGFYPKIHAQNLDSQAWLQSYYQTYLERDIRSLLNVGDIDSFARFIRLTAGRVGQLQDLSSLGNDAGVSHTTAKRWLSVLNASFVTFQLNPYYKNFNKRMIKSPKIYFYDCGLLCFLLGIRSAEQLELHPLRGQIFESFVIAEFMKAYFNHGFIPPIYFWRDSAGHEVDLIVEEAQTLWAYEFKSGQTLTNDYFLGLKYWKSLDVKNNHTALIYGGFESSPREYAQVYSWTQL